MRYIALATDYDGTLAARGQVRSATTAVLERVKASGRKLILVTGRQLQDLMRVFSCPGLFDCLVVENGGLLYYPDKREERALCEPPPESFLSLLREMNVPFEVGKTIVSTHVPYQTAVLDAIRRLALDLQVIFNKEAVMILPSGVNKATGLHAALTSLQLSFHNTAGIGDAENDHSFISACECGVAVANAVSALKQRADIETKNTNGDGVIEIVEELLRDDLVEYDSLLIRHSITLGTLEDDSQKRIRISPHRNSVLIAGPSASGKSTLAAGILEQLMQQDYQFCLIDPEGDFENFAGALSLGTHQERPAPEIVMKALENPEQSIIVNLMALPVAERPEYFAALLPRLLECRARTARPHWIVIDEAHHLLPSSWSPATSTMPQQLDGTILITVHPEQVSLAPLQFVDTVIATGDSATDVLQAFAKLVGMNVPSPIAGHSKAGQALVWFTREPNPPFLVRTQPVKTERRRHRKNYAEGKLSEEQTFYFRGPESKLRLPARNLTSFIDLAEGVDDDTWFFHLRNGDYSCWLERAIKDPDLVTVVREIQKDKSLSAAESRKKIREAIQSRYTAAA